MPHFIPPKILKIIDLLEQNGATDVLLVGGCVRDFLLNKFPKDFDIEVYGLSYSKIQDILRPYYRIDIVGQSFGVLKVGTDIDIALPRRESKNGVGHKGFEIETASNLSPEEAFARRDFTINAIGMRKNGTFCDPYNGRKDLQNKKLRAVSASFKDDPLRVLRGMQFTARFGFDTDEQTLQYCREVLPEFSTLAPERIYEEWKKWALKGRYLDKGLEFLRASGWLEAFPELAQLVGCQQNPIWHPEGDVWTHTLAVCREAGRIVYEFQPQLSDDEKLLVIFSALTHDLGKPKTTKLDENGVLRSLGHDKIGSLITRKFLEKMRAPVHVVQSVEKIVHEHMTDIDNPSPRAIRRLADRLHPANIKLWALVRQADAMGCGVHINHVAIESETNPPSVKFKLGNWLKIAEQLNVLESAPQKIVNGRDLFSLGVKPGPQMGVIIKTLYEAQLDGAFTTIEGGLDYIKQSGLLNN